MAAKQADIPRLLAEAAALKMKAEEATAQYDVKAAELVAAFQRTSLKTFEVPLPDGSIKGTLVEPQRTVLDEAGLMGALDPDQQAKVTKVVFDKAKLEAAVAVGVIEAQTVADHSKIVDVKPHVKITGAYTASAAEVAASVAIRDAAGHLKPAVRRVKPKGN